MAVALRLSRYGRTKRPFYRIVAADKAKPRDGRYLELLGIYDTLKNLPAITLKEDRVKYWIGNGATPSQTVASIVDKKIPGYLKGLVEARRAKIQATRAKRKATAKK